MDVLIFIGLTICPIVPIAARGQDLPGDPADLAAKVAPDVAAAIKAKFPGAQTARVVVFPAANSQGKVTMATASPAVSLQGELIQQLRKFSQGKFIVLSPRELADAFLLLGFDPQGIDSADPNRTADTLSMAGIHAAILPQFDRLHGSDLSDWTNWEIRIRFGDKSSDRVKTSTPGSVVAPPVLIEPGGPENPASGRFSVEVVVDGQPLPMKRVNEPDQGLKLKSDGSLELGPDGLPIVTDAEQAERHLFHNVYVLEIPPAFVAQEKAFEIRLRNRGTPFVRWQNAPNKDKDRLYAVSLLVDGVSSFMKDTGRVDANGNHLFDFEFLSPKTATKYVLSGPGRRAVGDDTKPAPGHPGFFLPKLLDAPGDGGSVVTVPGFQQTNDEALQFRFGLARREGVEFVGITDQIGLIEASFYPENLAGDQVVAGIVNAAHLQPPTPATSPVFFPIHPAPVEVWRIYYRVQGEPQPPGNKVLNIVQ